jgi:uncharacterized membrane protein
MSGSGTALRQDSNGSERERLQRQTPGYKTLGVNVGTLERVGSATLGVLLMANGLKRRSLGGTALAIAGGDLLYRGFSGHCHVYETIGLSTAEKGSGADLLKVQQSITINKTPEELYQAWRNPAILAAVMKHFAEVTNLDQDRTHWVINNPFGQKLEWDAYVVEDRPSEFLRWQSSIGAKWPNEGSVSFRPGPSEWGAEVTLLLRFDPPGADLTGAVLKRLNFVPRTLAHKALARFKSLMETGEIPTLEKNPNARTGDTANAY